MRLTTGRRTQKDSLYVRKGVESLVIMAQRKPPKKKKTEAQREKNLEKLGEKKAGSLAEHQKALQKQAELDRRRVMGPEERKADDKKRGIGQKTPTQRGRMASSPPPITPKAHNVFGDHDPAKGTAPDKEIPVGVRKKKNKPVDSETGAGENTSYTGASASKHRSDLQDQIALEKAKDRKSGGRASDSEIRNRARNAIDARRAREKGVGLDMRLEEPVPATHVDSMRMSEIEKSDQATRWKTARGLFTNPNAVKPQPQFESTKKFLGRLPTEFKRELDELSTTQGSILTQGLDVTRPKYGRKEPPGVTRRLEIISRALQQGASRDEAYAKAVQDNRGRSLSGQVKPISGQEPQYNRPEGRKSKYEALSPAPGNAAFSFGVSGASIDKLDKLRKKFPDRPDRDLIQMQQYQRMNIADEILKNQRWTHETQRASILGQAGKEKGPDRVVVFTTSLGHPAVSIPSDSLIGQYVIRRRKKIAQKEGLATPKMLKGQFPEAVRDLHVMELGTGISMGVEGSWGAFNRTGWRVNNKKSTGYGKSIPVGSQILYDRSGRAIYDTEGNVRFSDGATRRFKVGTDKDLGLRIFVG